VSSDSNIVEVSVPDIGGSEGAEVIELLVAVGDSVAVDDGLVLLESDKASMEIPSTVAGTVRELLVSEGDALAEGAAVARIEVADSADEGAGQSSVESEQASGESEQASDKPEIASDKPEIESVQKKDQEADEDSKKRAENNTKKRAEKASSGSTDSQSSAKAEDDVVEVYAGPAVRKLGREFGVALEDVKGSGPQGRVLKEDVQKHVREALGSGAGAHSVGGVLPTVPEIDFSKFGEVTSEERSKLDKLTAKNMHRSWLTVPHVTQFDEADISELETFRASQKAEAESRGTKLTPLPFILKACAVALRDNPQLNSSLAERGESLVRKHYIHIGMAVDTPAGLVVPVIRDVDQKSIWTLAQEVIDLATKAKNRKLTPTDMQGGCFTISSLGNIGGTGFTPIVNTPEVGILGVSKAMVKPLWNGEEFIPRTMLPLALSYDHRVVNGGHGGKFLTQLSSLLEDIRQLSM